MWFDRAIEKIKSVQFIAPKGSKEDRRMWKLMAPPTATN